MSRDVAPMLRPENVGNDKAEGLGIFVKYVLRAEGSDRLLRAWDKSPGRWPFRFRGFIFPRPAAWAKQIPGTTRSSGRVAGLPASHLGGRRELFRVRGQTDS